MKALLRKIRQLLRSKKIRKIWHRGVSTFAAIVVFVTTYALVLPAITLEATAVCGILEHQHDDSCYEEVLTCGLEESDGHQHEDSCYTTVRDLVCDIPEHTHSAENECYDAEGNLVCSKAGHTHEEGCYKETRELTCGLEESAGHHHGDQCYEKVLTCGREYHVHSAACYRNDAANTAETAMAAASTNESAAIAVSTSESAAAAASTGSAAAEGESTDTVNSGSASTGATVDIGFADDSYDYGHRDDGNRDDDGKTDASASATTNVLPEELEESAAEELSEGYVPALDPVNMGSVLTRHTGFYYFDASEYAADHPEGDMPENSGEIQTWQEYTDDVELEEADMLRLYLTYKVPAGSLNETNQVSRYHLPSNLHLTDDQIMAINETVNGAADSYVDMSTLEITDEDKYEFYRGAEAVEGDRTPDQDVNDYLYGLVKDGKEGQEYISAVVKAENVFDQSGEYVGQDLIFIWTPYSIEKNQNEYDKDGQPTKAGEKISGWFSVDFNCSQLDWIETGDNTRSAEVVFVDEDKSEGIKELSEKLTLADQAEDDPGMENEDAVTDTSDDPAEAAGAASTEPADADDADDSSEIASTESADAYASSGTAAVKAVDASSEAVATESADTDDSSESAAEDAAAGAAADKDETASTSKTGESAGTASDTASAEKTAEDETSVKAADYRAGTLTASGSDYTITVDYTADACISADAELKVTEITAESDPEAYKACLKQARASVGNKDEETTVDEVASRFFDIEILVKDDKGEAKKIEPKAAVNVNIQLDPAPAVLAGAEDKDQVQNQAELSDPTVLHFAKDGVETIESTTGAAPANDSIKDSQSRGAQNSKNAEAENATAIQFEASSFSIYGVVYTSSITKRYLSADGTSYDITVVYDEEAGIPADADLNVREIEPDTAEYLEYLRRSAAHLNDEDDTGEITYNDISFARFFDIGIVDGEGNKIEPKTPVFVNIEYAESDSAEINAAKDLHVVHFAENGTEVLEGIGVNRDGTVMSYLQDGFSVTGTVVTNPAANDQYMVLIEYEGNYYIVNNDGTLTNVGSSATGSVEVDEPMMWTYDGKNIYHHTEQVSFNNQQVAADFYNKYIDPTDRADGISTDQDNSGTTLRNINEQYFDWNTWSMKTFTYQVIQNRPQQNVTRVTLAGDKLKSANSEQYLGVVNDNGVLKLVGGVSAADAATVRLATANEVLKTNYLNHTVNHIDISIEGESTVEVPLAYGTYTYYNPDTKRMEEFEVTEATSLELNSGVVGITMDDMKRAIITAYKKNPDGSTEELDNAFVVNGYSANSPTAYSTQQVRIEGEFRVSYMDPVTQSYYNNNRERVWNERLQKKIYYKVTAYKTITFNLIDPEKGQLYDMDGNPLSVNVDVAFSASFDFWDQRNECPPVQWDNDWLAGKGTIPDHNLSGMDFVLGGNADGNAISRAVEIRKIIEDENGSPIELKSSLDHKFELYYYPDDTQDPTSHGTSDNLRNSPEIWKKGSDAYNNYDATQDVYPAGNINAGKKKFVKVQNIGVRVGTSGVGQSYTYDYNYGMFFIKEDTSKVPETITGADGETWYYASTVIETEYARRGATGIETYPYTEKIEHTAGPYTGRGNDYYSRAEVLGLYQNQLENPVGDNKDYDPRLGPGTPADNEFLEFTVHNIYKKTKAETTELNVTKDWDGEEGDVTEVYVKVFRKTAGGEVEDFTDIVKNDRDNQSLYIGSSNFDTTNGWIVIHKKTGSGNTGWETVTLKNVPITTEADPVNGKEEETYTYYIQEVGYKGTDGKIYRNVDHFNPQYAIQQTTDNDWQPMPDNGIQLESHQEGQTVNQFKVTNKKEEPVTTSYTVTKQFAGSSYPTDGSVQILVGLEEGYLTGDNGSGSSVPDNWKDVGEAVISLPRPYSEKKDSDTEINNEAEWFASPKAWTYTWENLNATKKVNGEEVTLWYRAKEISAPGWYVVNNPAGEQVTLPVDSATTTAEGLNGTVTNSPNAYDLLVDKKWAKDGKPTSWPDGVTIDANVVRYWHIAKIDENSDPSTFTLSDSFKTEQLTGTAYETTLSSSKTSDTFHNLAAYDYIGGDSGTAITDEMIVNAKKIGVTLDRDRKYLVVYTYGAVEKKITWSSASGDYTQIDLTVPGVQDGSTFTSNITNELTDITVKKQWRKAGEQVDSTWPDGAVVNYKVMRVPVIRTDSGKNVELDAQDYTDHLAHYAPLNGTNYSTGISYTNLPMQGVETLPAANKYGLVAGTYLVSYRYYVEEDPEGNPLGTEAGKTKPPTDSAYQYTAVSADVINGVATLTNEYTEITVDKKWVKKNSSGGDIPASFPEGFKVNWKVVQKDSDGNVINSDFYKGYTRLAEGAEGYHPDHRLEKGSDSYTLKYLPASGIVNGKEVDFTYEVCELPEGSEAGEGNTYLFQMIPAKEGEGENAGKFTIVNDLTKVTVIKTGDKGKSVTVQLYASSEKPGTMETVDVKVTLDQWGKDSWNNDRKPLDSGEVTGTLVGSDGSSRTFTLKPGNKWTDIFAGLPKYKSDGMTEIVYSIGNTNYPITDVSPAQNATVSGSNEALNANEYTIHLQATGEEDKVQFKFIRGDNWPAAAPAWRIAIVVKNGETEVYKTLDLGQYEEQLTPILNKGEYSIEYTFLGDHSGYEINGETNYISTDASGIQEYTIDLELSSTPATVKYEFTKDGDWPAVSDTTIPWNVTIEVWKADSGGTVDYSNTANRVWTKDLSNTETSENTGDLDNGTYVIRYKFNGTHTGYTFDKTETGGWVYLPARSNEEGTQTVPIRIEKDGPLPGQMEVNISVGTWKQNTSDMPRDPLTSGTIVFEIVQGSTVVEEVSISAPNWETTTYLDEGSYNLRVKAGGYNTTEIQDIQIPNGGGFSQYYGTDIELTIILPDLMGKYEKGFLLNHSIFLAHTPILMRANANHADVPIAAPTEPLPGTTGEHEITVVDKSNLPEGAVAVPDGEVTLDNSVDWTKTWENLPRVDTNGNPIYYYVVEKSATTDVNGVTSTTATYVVDQNPDTGEFTITINNKTTSEPPETGTIEVEKTLEGLKGEDIKFQFSLRSVTKNQYLNSAGNWVTEEALHDIYPGQKYTFTNLPLGNYVLKEKSTGTAVSGYELDETRSITGTAGSGISVIANGTSSFEFKNVYTPAPIRVTKKWKHGNNEINAPDGAEVIFRISRSDGQPVTNTNGTTAPDITLDGTVDDKGEAAAWVAEWKDLPRQTSEGTPVTYTITEVTDEDGYSWEHFKVTGEDHITYSDENAGDNVITNTEQTTQIQVTKRWNNSNGTEKSASELDGKTIRFTLYQTYTDKDGNTHPVVYTFAQQKAEGTSGDPAALENGYGEIRYIRNEETDSWQTIVISDLPEKVQGEDGDWYDARYFVEEDGIANVSTIYQLDGTGGSDKPEDAAASASSEIWIINTDDTTSLKVEKTWDDLGATTPYSIQFKLQSKLPTQDDTAWEDEKEDDNTTTIKKFEMVFNGSTYTIKKTSGTEVAYISNIIQPLDAGKQYRVVETYYKVTDASGTQTLIEKTFEEGEEVAGTSTTADNGRTWTSTLQNGLPKIKEIGGKKTWHDDKTSHADPQIILERTVDEWTTVEQVTALKMDPTVPAAAPSGDKVGTEESSYTYLYPVWSTESGLRNYSYSNLPEYSPQGLKYSYRVKEVPPPGYAPAYIVDGQEFSEAGTADVDETTGIAVVDIVNEPVGKLKVKKVWFAGATDEQMLTIRFKLEKSYDQEDWTPVQTVGTIGEEDSQTPAPTDDNGTVTLEPQTVETVNGAGETVTQISRTWEWTSGDLPRYEEVPAGSGIYQHVYYRVFETAIGENTVASEYHSGTIEELGWKITNPEPVELTVSSDKEVTIKNDKDYVSVSGTKTWVTKNPAKIPDYLELKLYTWTETTDPVTGTVTASEESEMTVSPADQATDTDPRLTWYKQEGSNVWTYAYTYLPKSGTPNQVIRYRVEEIMSDELKNSFTGEMIPGQTTEKGDITNWNFINTEKTSIKVIKKWIVNEEEVDDDPFDNNRTVKIQLIRKEGAATTSLGVFDLKKTSTTISASTSGAPGTGGEGGSGGSGGSDTPGQPEGQGDQDNPPTNGQGQDGQSQDGNNNPSANSWELTITDLAKYYRDSEGALQNYTYYVIEQDPGMWHVEYYMDDTSETPSDKTVSPNRMEATGADTPIYVENSIYTTVLPSSGGMGTKWIYILGGLLTGLSLFLLTGRKRIRT